MCLRPKLDADGRRRPSIGRCLGVDHLNPSFLNFDPVGKETSVTPVPQAQNSYPCES